MSSDLAPSSGSSFWWRRGWKRKNKTKRNSGLFRPLVQHEHGVNPTLAREIEIKTWETWNEKMRQSMRERKRVSETIKSEKEKIRGKGKDKLHVCVLEIYWCAVEIELDRKTECVCDVQRVGTAVWFLQWFSSLEKLQQLINRNLSKRNLTCRRTIHQTSNQRERKNRGNYEESSLTERHHLVQQQPERPSSTIKTEKRQCSFFLSFYRSVTQLSLHYNCLLTDN